MKRLRLLGKEDGNRQKSSHLLQNSTHAFMPSANLGGRTNSPTLLNSSAPCFHTVIPLSPAQVCPFPMASPLLSNTHASSHLQKGLCLSHCQLSSQLSLPFHCETSLARVLYSLSSLPYQLILFQLPVIWGYCSDQKLAYGLSLGGRAGTHPLVSLPYVVLRITLRGDGKSTGFD